MYPTQEVREECREESEAIETQLFDLNYSSALINLSSFEY